MAKKPTELATRPTVLAAREAADKLERILGGFRGELTVADASAKAGLALRDAETGLHELVSRYHGHLGATEKGELVFRFPAGLVDPDRGAPSWLRKVGQALAGVGRFMVRAWVSVVVVGYALVFGAIMIALATRSDSDDDGVGDTIGIVLRVMFEALYWTFHPFSPFYHHDSFGWGGGGRGKRQKKAPFYERVNRFVFGPAAKPERPYEEIQGELASEIRRLKGRIGVADVMRITGLGRGDADAVLSRLMLNLDGDVSVTDDGAIVYAFKELRQTASSREQAAVPQPFWLHKLVASPITGNTIDSNLLIGALNGFNVAASGYALASDLTIDRLTWLLSNVGSRSRGIDVVDAPPSDGVPLVLGLVPFVFSSALFVLPIVRAFRHPSVRRKIQAENGRRAVAARVMQAGLEVFPEGEIKGLFAQGAGRAGTDAEVLAAARSLGGDFDLHEDKPVYRFAELARERRALALERASARDEEQSAGQVVFSSDKS